MANTGNLCWTLTLPLIPLRRNVAETMENKRQSLQALRCFNVSKKVEWRLHSGLWTPICEKSLEMNQSWVLNSCLEHFGRQSQMQRNQDPLRKRSIAESVKIFQNPKRNRSCNYGFMPGETF